jgi:hypothetical protein
MKNIFYAFVGVSFSFCAVAAPTIEFRRDCKSQVFFTAAFYATLSAKTFYNVCDVNIERGFS